MVKIVSCEKHKSGVRLYIVSGQRAYRLAEENQKITDCLVHALSTPKEKLPQRIAAGKTRENCRGKYSSNTINQKSIIKKYIYQTKGD